MPDPRARIEDLTRPVRVYNGLDASGRRIRHG